jgi:hypothetical protein
MSPFDLLRDIVSFDLVSTHNLFLNEHGRLATFSGLIYLITEVKFLFLLLIDLLNYIN